MIEEQNQKQSSHRFACGMPWIKFGSELHLSPEWVWQSCHLRRLKTHVTPADIIYNNFPSCRLGLNQFADWSREEFLAVMLPNRGVQKPQLWPKGQQPVTYKRTIADEDLPQAVDWRGSGADSPVKDQAMCGSCWVSSACQQYWHLRALKDVLDCLDHFPNTLSYSLDMHLLDLLDMLLSIIHVIML